MVTASCRPNPRYRVTSWGSESFIISGGPLVNEDWYFTKQLKPCQKGYQCLNDEMLIFFASELPYQKVRLSFLAKVHSRSMAKIHPAQAE